MSTDKDDHKKVIDEISGIETTGHEWDGLRELNNPLPRWWVWVFLICVIWSVWYWVIYPAWPTIENATKGSSGYTQYEELRQNQDEIIQRQSAYLTRFQKASFDDILNDPELYAFAIAGGASAFKDNCATCHGTGAAGAKGYPNLNDDDWIWGGTLSDIYDTIRYGIRSGDLDGHISQMPAFGKEGLLNNKEIEDVVSWVMHISGQKEAKGAHEQAYGITNKESLTRGKTIFENQCASCHGIEGHGNRELGAPNLTDKIWLYGSDRHTVHETIYYARAGVMPAWKGRLSDDTIRQLTVYLHELGGGQ